VGQLEGGRDRSGGASGICAACATTLAREGAKVVITDLDDTSRQAMVDKIAVSQRGFSTKSSCHDFQHG
jgi:NAD(P)-dependent dehydrogenase (short-subunit alcohol dehydrogenase family)